MTPHRCPQCNAPMRPTMVGDLRDKRLCCDYCGCQIDVPDSSTIEEETTSTRTDPSGRSVRTVTRKTISRSDGPLEITAAVPGFDSVVEASAGPEGVMEFELVSTEPEMMRQEILQKMAEAAPPGLDMDLEAFHVDELVRAIVEGSADVEATSRIITLASSTTTDELLKPEEIVAEQASSGVSSARRPKAWRPPLVVIVAAAALGIIVLIALLG